MFFVSANDSLSLIVVRSLKFFFNSVPWIVMVSLTFLAKSSFYLFHLPSLFLESNQKFRFSVNLFLLIRSNDYEVIWGIRTDLSWFREESFSRIQVLIRPFFNFLLNISFIRWFFGCFPIESANSEMFYQICFYDYLISLLQNEKILILASSMILTLLWDSPSLVKLRHQPVLKP